MDIINIIDKIKILSEILIVLNAIWKNSNMITDKWAKKFQESFEMVDYNKTSTKNEFYIDKVLRIFSK